eukprot:389232_1
MTTFDKLMFSAKSSTLMSDSDTDCNVPLLQQLHSYKAEIKILKRKNHILENLRITQTSTRKEVETLLSYEYERKEEQYKNEIDNLNARIANQRTRMELKAIQYGLLEQISQDLINENTLHKQQNTLLQNKLAQHTKEMNHIQNERRNDIEALNDVIQQKDDSISALKQKLELLDAKYESLHLSRRESTPSVLVKYRINLNLDPSINKSQSVGQRTPTKLQRMGSASKNDKIDLSPMIYDFQFFEVPRLPSDDTLAESRETDRKSDEYQDDLFIHKTLSRGTMMLLQKTRPLRVSEQMTSGGKIVIKQLPYSKATHMCVNLYVEMHQLRMVVYFDKQYTIQKFVELLKVSEMVYDIIGDELEIDLYCGNEDGEFDEGTAPLELFETMAGIGSIYFYGKIANVKKSAIAIEIENGEHSSCCSVL